MPEIPDVVGGETIFVAWGNPMRDRAVMRYANAAARDVSVPVPVGGELAYLQDIGRVTHYDGDGSEWVEVGTSRGISTTFVNVPEAPNPALATINEDGSAVFESVTVDGVMRAEGVSTPGVAPAKATMFSDGSIECLSLTVRDVNQASIVLHRSEFSLRWRFRIDPGQNLLLETSLDGFTWQTEETWIRS